MSPRKYLIHLGTDVFRVQALLNNVGGKLQLAKSYKVLGYRLENEVALGDAFKLQNILDQVITERIFYERRKLLNNDICKSHLLDWPSLLETALHYTAAVLMRSDLFTEPHTSLENELSVNCSFLRPMLIGVGWLITRVEWSEECLDDMITVDVSCKCENIWRKLSNQHEYFLTQIIHMGTQNFYKGLDCSSTMNAHWYFNTLMQNGVDYHP